AAPALRFLFQEPPKPQAAFFSAECLHPAATVAPGAVVCQGRSRHRSSSAGGTNRGSQRAAGQEVEGGGPGGQKAPGFLRKSDPSLPGEAGSGAIVAAYRKTHLFDVELEGRVSLQESAFTNPGPEIVPPVSTPAGKVGLAVCYDLRFPEMSLALAQAGAELLTYPSAFTVPTGCAHWEVLLRARAIETQSYVVAAAQTGKHHQRRSSYGHTMVVDPWGSIVAQCGEGPGLCYAEIDLAYLRRVRQEMPVWDHRRTDLYGQVAAAQGLGAP
uniref:Nitrilase 1 n=1 Tax=Varanus komodoensis TaxID=61221 RepID=A0A8D2J3T0_VARKO